VFGDEIEYYCGNCGKQLKEKKENCPYCEAPLSVTLVTVSKREREWINPDKWQIGRKGWIQAQFLKRWLPKYEEWLYNTKHKSFGELASDEIRETGEEYKKFLEERTKQMKKWTIAKAITEKPEEKAETMLDDNFQKIVIDKLESLDKNIKRLVEYLEKKKEGT